MTRLPTVSCAALVRFHVGEELTGLKLNFVEFERESRKLISQMQ